MTTPASQRYVLRCLFKNGATRAIAGIDSGAKELVMEGFTESSSVGRRQALQCVRGSDLKSGLPTELALRFSDISAISAQPHIKKGES